jgi:hypothetical protein
MRPAGAGASTVKFTDNSERRLANFSGEVLAGSAFYLSCAEACVNQVLLRAARQLLSFRRARHELAAKGLQSEPRSRVDLPPLPHLPLEHVRRLSSPTDAANRIS